MTTRKIKLVHACHSSLEIPDSDVKKKQDVLTKACNKLFNLTDVLKSSSKSIDNKKTMTQATLDYFFKNCQNKEKNHVYANNNITGQKTKLQKQNSVGAYPIKSEIYDDYDINLKNRSRPATVCVDKICEGRDTAALALERPRKKLSFREPEITGYVGTKKSHQKTSNTTTAITTTDTATTTSTTTTSTTTSTTSTSTSTSTTTTSTSTTICNGILHRTLSIDDFELESQAMRVVRTIGQAFEVCHKLSLNNPEQEHDQDERDTLTQELLSDRLSDCTSDKPKKDLVSEDKLSPSLDDSSLKDTFMDNNKNSKPSHLEILPPPPSANNTRRSPVTPAETYSSPLSDILTSGSGGSGSLPTAGSVISAQHELQLMREQLEQQNQQTQAAMAQLHLAREQLAAEQSARLEAQARTHQLLIHNRELLDHIAALVAHLQGGEKGQQTPSHVTMPQHQPHQGIGDSYLDLTDRFDNNSVFQSMGLSTQGLIENRAVTSCLPTSPLRSTFNSTVGGILNFSYPNAMDTTTAIPSFDNHQLLQRLQTLSNFNSQASPCYNYNQLSFLATNPLFNQSPLYNNNYPLQSQPKTTLQKKFPSSPVPTRHSMSTSPVKDSHIIPSRNSEPRQLQINNNQQAHLQKKKSPSLDPFIKPLSQMGTLTTTDPDGRLRIIVPVPSSVNNASKSMAHLRISDEIKTLNGPSSITRSTSEKVPNRSELMSQMQRTMWARHTTK